jgi:hypothetical protein
MASICLPNPTVVIHMLIIAMPQQQATLASRTQSDASKPWRWIFLEMSRQAVKTPEMTMDTIATPYTVGTFVA